MNSHVAVGSEGNLWYIPNEIIENSDATVYAFGNDLLLQSFIIDDNSNMKNAKFKLVSLADGTLISETQIPCGWGITVQVRENSVCIIDTDGGQVTVLNERLKETATYDLNFSPKSKCYLSTDANRLFCFDDDGGLYSFDLSSEARTGVIANATQFSIIEASSEFVVFSYLDLKSQLNHCTSLNLKTGDLEAAPMRGELWEDTFRSGDNWIIRSANTNGDYAIFTLDTANVLHRDKNNNDLSFAPQDCLLMRDLSANNLNLYDLNGRFISHCSLPENCDCYNGRDLIWSEHWNGYFFTGSSGESDISGNKLLFWAMDVKSDGSDLLFKNWEEASVPGGVSADAGLYKRAAEMSERFGVDIRIADQCQLDYDGLIADGFIAKEENNSDSILSALYMLEKALARYPDGFFRQLSYGYLTSVRIELVAELLSPEEQPNTIAFAKEDGDHSLIVMDINVCTEWEFYHEVSHIIDKRLEWDAKLRQEAIYSEDAWIKLQPEGFDYAYSYTDIPYRISAFSDSGYFVRSYSLISPTEDRATVMEQAMSGYIDIEAGDPLWEKLDFYSRCIRDCFDTSGWPEVTAWEESL